jgi:hypothetical protein
MRTQCVEIDAVEQQVELVDRELDHGLLTARPGETIHLEPFQHQPEAGPIVEQQLYTSPFPVVESEDGSCERIELHRLFNHRYQRIQSGPEVDRLTLQVDPKVVVEAEHPLTPTATISALTRGASCAEHSRSITTPLGSRADRRARGGAAADATSRCAASIVGAATGGVSIVTTGTKAGMDGSDRVAATTFFASAPRTH